MTSQRFEGFTRWYNPDGPSVSTADAPVIQQDGLVFRDLERTGVLEPYEDWRLSADERARDLAARLTVEEIAGLMMYSPHQMVPSLPGEPFQATYQGKPFPDSGCEPYAMSDQQQAFLRDHHVRHVLVVKLPRADDAARWHNNMQRFAEALPHGIPVSFSSDPRHGAGVSAAEYKSAAASTSKWPEGLGLAATFSPDVVRAFGEAVRREYRALGVTTALSPQVDVGTEPRWMRIEDTFGADPDRVAELGRIYCDALQTTPGAKEGWGSGSVVAMAKHWPGGGPCEGGRDAHYPFGKFAVYPGNCRDLHMKPFVDGVFKLHGPTGCVGSVMPYYTISHGTDASQEAGNAYSRYIINDLLRQEHGFDGVVCTDWGVTGDPAPIVDSFGSRCFGAEELTEAQRHLRIIENGADQFGGNSNIHPILEAYRIGCERHGEKAMRERFERSAVRLLRNLFRCGLFDDPYLDPQESLRIVGSEELRAQGFEAQVRSVVLLKNTGVLPLRKRLKAYVPGRSIRARKGFFRNDLPARQLPGAWPYELDDTFDWVDTPEEADVGLAFIESPLSDGYSSADLAQGGNGYLPISLQYRPYRAVTARAQSIAGGDFRESTPNRSYRDKVGTAANESDLDTVMQLKQRMGDKPVVVSVRIHNPMVFAELEPYADAILADFGVQKKAILRLVCGDAEPTARLPVCMPKDMAAVEAHAEDAPLDYAPYTDTQGNRYDYGFGLGWHGPIRG